MDKALKNLSCKRNLTSYCHRYYTIEKWDENIVGYVEIERMDKELSEVAMKQYMVKKYGIKGYRLIQVIISEIYYEVE